MLKLFKKYRAGYTGEEIIAERRMIGGQWSQTTEHVPNNVTNNQISNRAVVFGNGPSRNLFPIDHLLAKKSGLLGADTLQTYACNAFYRDYTPDFLVVTDRRIAQEVSSSDFIQDNIVYTRVDISLEFPRKFYLIPHDPYGDAGATAAYLACFDGHKKIYLLGFDGQDTPGKNNNIYAGTNGYDPVEVTESPEQKWNENMSIVFSTYNDVNFAIVSQFGKDYMPEIWKPFPNVRQLSHRDFVLECDL
jgi:hypothetical protein